MNPESYPAGGRVDPTLEVKESVLQIAVWHCWEEKAHSQRGLKDGGEVPDKPKGYRDLKYCHVVARCFHLRLLAGAEVAVYEVN